MKNRNNSVIRQFKLVLCLLAMTFSYGCSDFVEADIPASQLGGPQVFQDAATANAAVVNLYSRLQRDTMVTGGIEGTSYLMGLYADELTYYSSSTTDMAFFQNAVLPTNSYLLTIWNNSYNVIYAANSVIEGIEASSGIPQADADRLIGEALFVRTYLHFYLSQLFGPVPYVAQTDYRINATLPRTDVPAFLTLLSSDLEHAALLLPEEYTGQNRVRVNRSAAKALQARIFLYAGDNQNAAVAASTVIDNTAYAPATNLEAAFLKESTNIIWQLMPATAGANTLEGSTFIFNSGPPPNTALTPSLVAAFEPGDLRFSNWVRTISNGSGSWYHAYKYKQNALTSPSMEYSVQLRIEEMYLVRAEARANLGDLNGAAQDLNLIRNRSGLPDTDALGQSGILSAILRERRVEFFTELGHRLLDLKRSGQIDALLSIEKQGWNTTDALLPIPDRELLLNQNLAPQNPGY